MSESIIEQYSVKELDAYNQGLDRVLEILKEHHKAYHIINPKAELAIEFAIREIKDNYV